MGSQTNLNLIYSSGTYPREVTIRKLLADANVVERNYIEKGVWLGEALSYSAYGRIIGLDRKVDRLVQAERAYADLGYRPMSIDAFVELGGWGKDISDLFRQKRVEGEDPIFHARQYQEEFKLELKENGIRTAWEYLKAFLA
ncbi:TPA: hypothetical protein HA242_04680 [Candidatus Woesearchaeota archaeon]|nr:hypothetical protein [Candidatus Woesearchaeota archaeon]